MDIYCTLSLDWIKDPFIHVSAFAYTRKTLIFYFNVVPLQRCTNIAIRTLEWNLGDDVKIGRVSGPKEVASTKR